MPEGDTILRAARTLQAALAGRTVSGFASSLVALELAARRRVVGRRVLAVSSAGKHLLLSFEGGAVLHTHLGMHGRWRLQGASEPRPAGAAARAVIVAGDVVALCIGAPVVELLSQRELRSHPQLSRLGPDVLGESFDALSVRLRLRADGEREIGDALLDQRLLAGVGNIFKAEALFACGLFPRRRVSELDDATLERLIATVRRLMQRNLGAGPRRTLPPAAPLRYSVYGRAGRPCRRCGTLIERLVQGSPPRSTAFCPRCQPPR
jgi:endonuclease-8